MQGPTSSRLIFAAGFALLLLGAAAMWFYPPTHVEDLDRLGYCACGYSAVRFHDGSVTMVQYLHPTVPPGQRIGTYHVAGNQVEMTVWFHGKEHRSAFTLDRIGLLNPPGAQFPFVYRAYSSHSPRLPLYTALLRLRSEWAKLGERFAGG